MAQRVKAFAAKPGTLSLIPWIHMVKGKNQLPQTDLHRWTMHGTCKHTQKINKSIYTYKKSKKDGDITLKKKTSVLREPSGAR